MDDKTMKEKEDIRKAILDAADHLEKNASKYCGHRNQADIKMMGRGNAFAWIQEMFHKNTGKHLTVMGAGCQLDHYRFQANMEEFNGGKQYLSCGGKRYPLWTRDPKAAADGLRKYAAKHFRDLDEAKAKKLEQEKKLLLAQEAPKNAFLPKDEKKGGGLIKL